MLQYVLTIKLIITLQAMGLLLNQQTMRTGSHLHLPALQGRTTVAPPTDTSHR